MKYRKKPVVIEAIMYSGDNYTEIEKFVGKIYACGGGRDIEIPTLEGIMRATIGDMIIKGVKGEFYPCKPDIFEATYEQVE